MPSPTDLLIVSHVCHYIHDGKIYAYTPYAREVEIWADLFPLVRIACPLKYRRPESDSVPINRPNIRIWRQLLTGGRDVPSKLYQIVTLPLQCARLAQGMVGASAVHVRCPGNLGLLGALIAPLFCRLRVAKFAGQWIGFPSEPATVALQRRILKSRWWGAPVTVYGEWPGQPAHVIPFFNSAMTRKQMAAANKHAGTRAIGDPLRILFVGRMTREKNAGVILEAMAQLDAAGVRTRCRLLGDGSERNALREQATQLGVAAMTSFSGAVRFDAALAAYREADVLVLLSESEGWPKVIVEAMAYGLICIGRKRGLVPAILGDHRGIVLSSADAGELAAALKAVRSDHDRFVRMGRRASDWARQFTIEDLKDKLRGIIETSWDVKLGHGKV